METRDIQERLLNEWEHFKRENDERLAELRKYGEASAEANQKVDRLNDSISQLRDRLVELENRVARPPVAVAGGLSDEQIKGFKAWMRTGIRNAAMQEGTDAEGGYVVPTPMYQSIVMGLQEQSILRMAGARVIDLPSWKMTVPTLTNSTAAVQTDEEGAVSEVEPTVGQVTFQAYRFTKLVKASRELVADSAFDLWGVVLAPDFAQAFAKAENSAFTTGDGSGHPQGVVTGATVGKTAAATNAFTPDEVIDLYFALDYRHRPRAKFMANDAVIKVIRKFKVASTTGGNDQEYLWAPGLTPGIPDTLLGRPLITNNSMASALQASAKVLLFGDFDYFWIGQRPGMELQRLVELYAGTGQIGFLADRRVDSHVMLATAFQVLQMASA